MNLRKNCALMIFGGAAYGLIELLWRGRTHWSMVLTGGFCFAALNYIFKKLSFLLLFQKCLVGSAFITVCEYLCGLAVNIKLKLNVWDYSNHRLNIRGQICPMYTALWTLLCIPICALCSLFNSKKTKDAVGLQRSVISPATFIFLKQNYASAITSTSTSTFLGRVFTATQERAGLPVKYFP